MNRVDHISAPIGLNVLSATALVVEDDPLIANLLKIHLTDLGFKVDIATCAEAAYSLIHEVVYDICLLDWMLPGEQGIDFLKKIRIQKNPIQVLMLTAKADVNSIVLALESGADDYLVKPFDAKVLLARVRNLLRRTEFQKSITLTQNQTPRLSVIDQINLDGLSVHFLKYKVAYREEEIHLTPSEFKLLASLVKAQGHVLTRDQLMGQIQGDEVIVSGRTIDTHVFALRKKLGVWATHIETIRGIGYRILISDQDYTSQAQE